MTQEQEKQWQDLQDRRARLAGRLQRIADVMGNRAIRRHQGVTRSDDAEQKAADVGLWEETMARIEEVTDKQEQLLQEAGILPRQD